MRSIQKSQAGSPPPLNAHRIESHRSKQSRFSVDAQQSDAPEKKEEDPWQQLRTILQRPGATDRPDFEELLAEFDRLTEERKERPE